jgi:hypothetical protein
MLADMSSQRSPRYPAISLAEAITAARALWSKEKRTPVGDEVLAKAVGYKSLSGASRTMIAALRQYGLINKQLGGWSLSDSAMEIIHNTDGSAAQLKAVQGAALEPILFHDLFATHPHGSEDAIKSYLILKKGFLDAGAKQAAAAYRDTIAFAKLNETGYTPTEEDAMAGTEKLEEAAPDTRQRYRNQAEGAQAMGFPAGGAFRQDVFSLAEGPVTIQWPASLSSESIQDLGDWLKILERKIKRSVLKSEPEGQ